MTWTVSSPAELLTQHRYLPMSSSRTLLMRRSPAASIDTLSPTLIGESCSLSLRNHLSHSSIFPR